MTHFLTSHLWHPGLGEILEAKRHPEALANHIENVSLANFSGHLEVGVRASWVWDLIFE